MSFWTKEEELESSEVDEKEQTFGKQTIAGPLINKWDKRDLVKQIFTWILPVCHTYMLK